MAIVPWDVLIPFIVTCSIIELTPGPNMAYLAVLSASDGRRAGFAAVGGVALGLLTIGAMVALGLAALISSFPIAYQALKWGGVFYLLWLAWDGWHTENETSPGTISKDMNSFKFFKRGLITNLLNPKAAIFYVAILPDFIQASSHVVMQAIILTVVYVAIATAIHTFIVMLAGAARVFFEDQKRSLVIRRVLSLFLVGIAFWFAWDIPS